MDAIKVTVIEHRHLSSYDFKYFEVILSVSQEFKNEPEGIISEEEKNEIIAEKIKKEFLKFLNK